MKTLDRKKLIDHIDACIDLAERKQETKVAEVLKNLKKEIKAGEFSAAEQ
ncbi:hypothetical protein [Paenibacillus sp. GCM10027626]